MEEIVYWEIDPKKVKKEAKRVRHEAEKQKCAMAEKAYKEQARAVLLKRKQLLSVHPDLEWKQRSDIYIGGRHSALFGPIRQNQG